MAAIPRRRASATRSSRGWKTLFWIALPVSLVTYLLAVATGNADASSPWGMTYGTAAALFMVGAALYGVRRRTMRRGVGRARSWQQFHVYGGSLFLVLTLMHAAFRLPRGEMTTWLMILSVWVFLSGLLGLFIQKWIPGLLRPLGSEVLYDRIPELAEALRRESETLVADLPPEVRDFYRTSVAPEMAGPVNRIRAFVNPRSGIADREREFALLRDLVPAGKREQVQELESLHLAKLELDAHYTLQKALRWWLYIHVPPSLALLGLVGLHIFAVFYY